MYRRNQWCHRGQDSRPAPPLAPCISGLIGKYLQRRCTAGRGGERLSEGEQRRRHAPPPHTHIIVEGHVEGKVWAPARPQPSLALRRTVTSWAPGTLPQLLFNQPHGRQLQASEPSL